MMRQTCFFSIASDHPAFAGHFPGMPVVPGVVLLDEALHALGRMRNLDFSDCRISAAKFLSPVLPGQQLCIGFEVAGATLRFDIYEGARKVAAGALDVDPDPDNGPAP
jgi:3-hydroxymyristoyl/3-hydroxydecanoyl-(acyl carrier protein) dehydratase